MLTDIPKPCTKATEHRCISGFNFLAGNNNNHNHFCISFSIFHASTAKGMGTHGGNPHPTTTASGFLRHTSWQSFWYKIRYSFNHSLTQGHTHTHTWGLFAVKLVWRCIDILYMSFRTSTIFHHHCLEFRERFTSKDSWNAKITFMTRRPANVITLQVFPDWNELYLIIHLCFLTSFIRWSRGGDKINKKQIKEKMRRKITLSEDLQTGLFVLMTVLSLITWITTSPRGYKMNSTPTSSGFFKSGKHST